LSYVALPLSALHSFPTRRSSDLNAPLHGIWSDSIATHIMDSSQPSKAPCPTSLVAWQSPSLAGTRSSASSATVGRRSSSWDETRSEEHTSELQSRGHLVCRLLLE